MAGKNPSTGPKVKVFDCPSCGAGVILRGMGKTLAAACGSCGSVIDVTNDNFKILSEAAKRTPIEPLLPLGGKGKIRGNIYEVIGFLRRSDTSGAFEWSEYLLFNPYKGFRWLTENDGHWSYLVVTKERPRTVEGGVRYLGQFYRKFLTGSARVTYVVGEFYWKVKVGETAKAVDYVHPPQMLSQETSDQEVTWTAGEYLEPEEIRASFPMAKELPPKKGVAPNQPSPSAGEARKVNHAIVFFIAALLGVQILTDMMARSETAFTADYHYSKLDPEKIKQSTAFPLGGGTHNVNVRVYAEVKNSWLNVGMTLANDAGGTWRFGNEVAYYSGTDSDGSWSEGNHYNEVVLPAIPEGTYHLTLEPELPADVNEVDYKVSVERDVSSWSNFFFFELFMLGSLLVVWLRDKWFEGARWQQSDPTGAES